MTQILAVAGCSKCAGTGFDEIHPYRDFKDSPDLWVNLCHQRIPEFNNLILENKSFGGASNLDIFIQAINCVNNHGSRIKYLICAWTSMPRYSFELGFELYTTLTGIGLHEYEEANLNDIKYSSAYLTKVINRFKTLIHLQKEIVNLINYINTLKKHAEAYNIQVININALCPWDNNFFTFQDYKHPEELSNFTKKEILNMKNRDDTEIRALYKKQHQQYLDVGGIQENTWVNLYNSFAAQQIDVNFDNQHAGIKSNIIYFQQVKNFIKNKQSS